MIQTKYGDLLEAKGVIVHGCNAQGVMGGGVALQIKNKWPDVYRVYLALIEWYGKDNLKLLGKICWWFVESQLVINMITQRYYGRDNKQYVDYEAVREGFRTLNRDIYKAMEFYETTFDYKINFPMIGCGLANGDWNIVSKIIDEELDDKFEKILWIRE